MGACVARAQEGGQYDGCRLRKAREYLDFEIKWRELYGSGDLEVRDADW